MPKEIGSFKTRVICVYRSGDRGNVVRQIENNGGIVNAVITVPFWNVYGQIVGEQYAVVYQSIKELSIQVQC